MGRIHETIHVDAPLAQVWALSAAVDRLPEWQTGLKDVKDVKGPLDHVGAGYTATYRIAGREIEVRNEVAAVTPMREVVLKGGTPMGGDATARIQFEPEGSGTKLTVDFQYELPGSFLGMFADRVFIERAMEREFRHSNENFKAIAEAEAKVPA